MRDELPRPISAAEERSRQSRVTSLARRLGFVGVVEYRHVSTRSGGAQFGMGPSVEQDELVVYPEAFRRNADVEDFSLEAIIAHERGHQMLCRHERLRRYIARTPSPFAEEILALLLGSLIAEDATDRQLLFSKAVAELLEAEVDPAAALRLATDLRFHREKLL